GDTTIRAVLLTGAGRGFCAGQDLGERAATRASGGEVEGGKTLETWYNPLVCRLRGLEKPVVCAVNGIAAGAGANIALACDIVLALIKEALNASFANTLDQQLDLERDLQAKAAATADFREGVAAFLEKRPANFVGR